MLKKLIFLILLAVTGAGAWAQTTVSGGVYDFSNKSYPLAGVSVQNLTNKSFATTNDKGRFTIAGKTGDLLAFAQIGFQADTVLLINDLPKTVFLVPKAVEIGGVDINAVKISPYLNVKDPDAKESKRFYTEDVRNKDNNDRAGGLKMALGYGKMRREKAKLEAIAEKEFYDAEIDEKFSKQKLFDLLKLNPTDMKNFMDLFRPTIDQVKNQRPFNYDYYIVTAYHMWLKLPPENRKLQALPKLKANP